MELACHAEKSRSRCHCFNSSVFFQSRETVDELIDFFAPVCRSASGLPFYYYNMPSITGVNLPVDRFLVEGKKKKYQNLVGTKI